ncbi:MAG: ATP-dependent RNA helicase ddx42 [Paramarteilia canceri]
MAGIFDDYEEKDKRSVKSAMKTSNEREELDSLDSYMMEINSQLAKEENRKPEAKNDRKNCNIRDDIEEMDDQEKFFEMMEKDPSLGIDLKPNEYVDFETDSNGNVHRVKKTIEPLPKVDHLAIKYPPFVKNLRKFPNSNSNIQSIRNELEINIHGNKNCPGPIKSFSEMNLNSTIIEKLSMAKIERPTAIQAQCIPAILSGLDLVGIAETGSGKTAAFVVPLAEHLEANKDVAKIAVGPKALITCPTRELAFQILVELKKLTSGLKAINLAGGESTYVQQQMCAKDPDVVVATPGRLIDLIKKGAITMKNVTFLVFDEADKMFNMGFEQQVRSISESIRKDRQSTRSKKMESLIQSALKNPVKVSQGLIGQANTNIDQLFLKTNSDQDKKSWLISNLTDLVFQGLTIIFINQKVDAELLSNFLSASGFQCRALHGDLSQGTRKEIMTDFRNKKFSVLIATDLASRGLDVPSVRTVINYELPAQMNTYIHRVGRTGRAGQTGRAFTLVFQKDINISILTAIYQQLKSEDRARLSNELMQMAQSSTKKSTNLSSTKQGFGYNATSSNKHQEQNIFEGKSYNNSINSKSRAKTLKESLKASFHGKFVASTQSEETPKSKSRWD